VPKSRSTAEHPVDEKGPGKLRATRHGIAILCIAIVLVLVAGSAQASPGALDTSFGSDGKITTAIGNDDHAHAIALQPNGKIIAAGESSGGFALARYNPNGSLDPGFGSGGTVKTAFGSFAVITAIALQPAGKIVAAGFRLNAGQYDFSLARYNSDGSLDMGFGSGGTVTTDFGSDDYANAIALQPDGKIVAVGQSGSHFALARYNPNGSLDTTFGSGGTVTTSVAGNGAASGIALQPDGKLVAAGESDAHFALARYKPDGSLDPSFGSGGEVASGIGGNASALVQQPDGKLVLGGFENNGTGYQFGLARFDANGSPDTTFGSGGTVMTPIEKNAFVRAIALQPDGKILASGYAYYYNAQEAFALARYNPNGSVDAGFGSDGTVTTYVGSNDTADAVALEADGKVVAAGSSSNYGSPPEFALVRYLGSTVTVSRAGPGSGKVSSSPAGIDCGSTCSAPFAAVPVTLTATPAAGSVFSGWSGAGCSGTGTCRVQVSSSQTVTATFKRRLCEVPRLRGKTLAAARNAVKKAYCSVGKVTRAFSSKVKAGRVISQKPAPGKRLPPHGKVRLKLSKGKRR
jgi:uncharacterized delta-60 repeat protein